MVVARTSSALFTEANAVPAPRCITAGVTTIATGLEHLFTNYQPESFHGAPAHIPYFYPVFAALATKATKATKDTSVENGTTRWGELRPHSPHIQPLTTCTTQPRQPTTMTSVLSALNVIVLNFLFAADAHKKKTTVFVCSSDIISLMKAANSLGRARATRRPVYGLPSCQGRYRIILSRRCARHVPSRWSVTTSSFYYTVLTSPQRENNAWSLYAQSQRLISSVCLRCMIFTSYSCSPAQRATTPPRRPIDTDPG